MAGPKQSDIANQVYTQLFIYFIFLVIFKIKNIYANNDLPGM